MRTNESQNVCYKKIKPLNFPKHKHFLRSDTHTIGDKKYSFFLKFDVLCFLVRFTSPYTGKYGSDKARILAYLKQCFLIDIGYPVGIYLLKVNNKNTRIKCEICLKLTIKSFWCLYC